MTSKRRKMNDKQENNLKQSPSINDNKITQQQHQQTTCNSIDDYEDALSLKTNIIMRSDYSKQLLQNLNLMRNDTTLCDYEIRCNGHVYNVHKFILIAISDFFKAMLTGNTSFIHDLKANF